MKSSSSSRGLGPQGTEVDRYLRRLAASGSKGILSQGSSILLGDEAEDVLAQSLLVRDSLVQSTQRLLSLEAVTSNNSSAGEGWGKADTLNLRALSAKPHSQSSTLLRASSSKALDRPSSIGGAEEDEEDDGLERYYLRRRSVIDENEDNTTGGRDEDGQIDADEEDDEAIFGRNPSNAEKILNALERLETALKEKQGKVNTRPVAAREKKKGRGNRSARSTREDQKKREEDDETTQASFAAIGHRPSLVTLSTDAGLSVPSVEHIAATRVEHSPARHHFPQGSRSKVWTAAGRPLRKSGSASGAASQNGHAASTLRLDLAVAALRPNASSAQREETLLRPRGGARGNAVFSSQASMPAVEATMKTRPIPLELPLRPQPQPHSFSSPTAMAAESDERERMTLWRSAGITSSYPQLELLEEGVKGVGSRRNSLTLAPPASADSSVADLMAMIEAVTPAMEEPTEGEEDADAHRKMAEILSAGAARISQHPRRHAPNANPLSFAGPATLGGSAAGKKAKRAAGGSPSSPSSRQPSPPTSVSKATSSTSTRKPTLFGIRGAQVKLSPPPPSELETAAAAIREQQQQQQQQQQRAPPPTLPPPPFSPSFFSPKTFAAISLPPAPHTPLGLPSGLAGLNLLGLKGAVEAEVESHLPVTTAFGSASSPSPASKPSYPHLRRPYSSGTTPTASSVSTARSAPLSHWGTGEPQPQPPRESIGSIAMMAILGPGRRRQEAAATATAAATAAAASVASEEDGSFSHRKGGSGSGTGTGTGGQLYRRHSVTGHDAFPQPTRWPSAAVTPVVKQQQQQQGGGGGGGQSQRQQDAESSSATMQTATMTTMTMTTMTPAAASSSSTSGTTAKASANARSGGHRFFLGGP